MPNQIFKIKFNEIKNHQEQLNKVSGLYFYHINGNLKYVGKSKDLWNRFNGGYLKKESKQHRNPELMQLVKSNSSDIEVIFKLLPKNELKEAESRCIQDWIPQLNITENPRYEIHSIQRVIARIVNETNQEWTYDKMREYLGKKWRNIVSMDRIDEALRDENRNLTRYCSRHTKKQILFPKKKEA